MSYNDGWTQEQIDEAIAKLTKAQRKEHEENAVKQMIEKGGYFALQKDGTQIYVDARIEPQETDDA